MPPVRTALAVMFVVAVCPPALGQTAQITGRITDAGSAALPAAAITIANVDTEARREVVSNGAGYYAAPFLRPGTYRVVVRLAGFRPFARDGVILPPDQTVRIDVTLELGEFEVRIDAAPSSIDRDSPAVGHVVDRHSMAALPLNGRNYFQQVALAPGAVRNPASRPADGFNLNGQRTWQNSFLIDGLDNNNYILGGGTGSIQAIRPSLDAIEQVTIDSATYGAEHGRAAGGVISVVTKSGTNAFHGSAFEFMRHDALEATDFFAKRASQPPAPLRYHQFGGTLGGPLLRNRAFFFASYQGTRERRTHTAIVTVPTPEMLRGDFGPLTIYDPAVVGGARQPFTNNTIPAERMDPVGRRIAALYPSPNRPGSINNFAGSFERNEDQHQLDLRIDHRLSDASHLFVRYSRSDRDALTTSVFDPPGYGQPAVTGLTERQQVPGINAPRASSLVAGETHVFSNAVVHELRTGFSINGADAWSLASRPLFEDFGIAGIDQTGGLTGLPVFTVQGFGVLGDRGNIPRLARTTVLQLADNLSWVRGSHMLRLGGDVRLTANRIDQIQQARGEFVFNGQFTSGGQRVGGGSALADLLLGQTSSARLSTNLRGEFSDQYYAFYISDTWKLRPSLTVNLGVRYELQTPMLERRNRMSNFDADPGETFGTLVPAREGGIRSRAFTKLDLNNVAPRVGLTRQIDPRTRVRGAFGVFYAGLGFQEAQSSGIANVPHFVRVSFPSSTDAAVSTLVLANGFPVGALDPRNVRTPTASAVAPELPLTKVRQWSVGVDRELPGTFTVSLSYVGSSSSHLTALTNVNAPAPGPGPLAGRRPFPTYGDIIQSSDAGEASYHALQTKIERRFRGRFSVLATHTWSHAIDNATDVGDAEAAALPLPQNPDAFLAEKASSAFDVRHRLVTSFTYDLPVRSLSDRSRVPDWLKVLAGGWRMAGILSTQTGVPMTPLVGTNPANTGTAQRPDCLRGGNLPRDRRTLDQWFDVSAFAAAAQYSFGNCGRHVLRAPGFVNLDLLVARTFDIGGARRVELRAEAFNFTNAVHLGRPHLVITDPQAGPITSTQAPPRQIQVGLRFVF